MNIDESIFAVKLYEMEEQYGRLQCRIRICEKGDRDKIRSELKRAEEEYEENTLLLEERAKLCRSKAVNRLAQAQIEYRHRISDIMKSKLMSDLHCEDSTPQDDEREADMLYAEFAMDFATLAVQQALICAMTALNEEKSAQTEKNTEKEQNTEEKKGELQDA